MKRIFLLFTLVTALFNACSNDNTPVLDNDGETYPISFRITMPLTVDGSTFKSTVSSQKISQIALSIYNEKGNFISTFLYNDRVQPDMEYLEDGSTQIKLSLPKGIYHLAFYTMEFSPNNPIKSLIQAIPFISFVTNFSDTYPLPGNYTYYESVTTTVAPTNQTIEQDITLKPMWSNVNITLEDAQTLSTPEGTDALQFVVYPLYAYFQLDTKLATFKVPENWNNIFLAKEKPNIVSLDSIRANATFTYPTYVYQTLPENGNLAIKVNYLKTKNTTDTIVLKTRELQIPDISIENGYNYNISGKLDAVNNGQSMNVSLGEFNKEDVVIEF